MQNPQQLANLVLFVAVVKNKSFSKTAQTLNIPQSTLSRKINELENHLGLKLIHRTTRKLELTEAGLFYFERTTAIVDEINRTHQAMNGLKIEPKGVLKLSVNNEIADWLMTILPKFYQKYPKIQLHIDVSAQKTDLLAGGVDMAIRAGIPKENHYIVHPLSQSSLRLFASKAYLDKLGTPKTPDELAHHHGLAFLGVLDWELSCDTQVLTTHPKMLYHSNSFRLLSGLAKQGLGIALLPNIAADTELIPVLPDWQGKPVPIIILTATRLLPIKVRYMIDFLKENVGQLEALGHNDHRKNPTTVV
ncbi:MULTISPECIES: LysR family transcriptional regulator [unclassified Moraxella]|uniref:LysR family transcriptional regulator n=1 Tax=unclassified Moraxella TaxID=2685852 RepID=UPI00359E3B69